MPRQYTRRPRVQLRDRQVLRRLVDGRAPSPRAFALAAGLSAPTLAHLLRGSRTHVLTEVAEKLCAALGVEVGSLFLPDTPTGRRQATVQQTVQETSM